MDLLHQLRHLNQSSPGFPDQLTSLLHERGYRDCVTNLQDRDLVWLVEYLDIALNILYPASPTSFRKCLRELREICGSRKILPQSCTFPGSSPDTVGWPVASRGSGDIYKGYFGDSTVCVKRLRIYSNGKAEATKNAFREAVVWKHLEHPNIVPLLGVTVAPFQFVSVWMPGGELLEYIDTHPSANRLGLVSDIADGLSYLHSYGVIHGDLKGPSILIDDTGRARLTDFGLATVAPDLRSAESITDGQAVRWAAPEILDRERPVSMESDVYSFSMVVVEAFTGKAPFHDCPPTTAAVGILSGNRPGRPAHPSVTDDLWNMMKRCWDREPERRPKISQVVLCLQTTSLRTSYADMNDNRPTDDATLTSVPRKKGFWFSRHRARQSSTYDSSAKREDAPPYDGVSPVSSRTEDRSVAFANSPIQLSCFAPRLFKKRPTP